MKDPTRGQAVLDKIWTNMSLVYAKPIILFELGTSDHNMFFIKPNNESIIDTGSIVCVTIRCMNSDNKARFAEMLRAVKWENLFRMKSCNEQYICHKLESGCTSRQWFVVKRRFYVGESYMLYNLYKKETPKRYINL